MSEAALKTLLGRLETVTKRLEVLEGKLGTGGSGGAASGKASGSASAGAGGDEWNPSVVEMDELIRKFVDPWVETSKKLGGETAEIAPLYRAAVTELRNCIVNATACKKPDQAGLAKFVKPLADAMGAVTEFRNSKRGSKEWDHLSTVSEGVAAFGWVCVSPTPGPFAMQSRAGSEFYSNKLLRAYKGKDETQMKWISDFSGFLKGMEPYIRDHHRTGLTFSGTGDAASVASSAAPKKAAVAPPPQPKAGQLDSKPAKGKGGIDRGGLFASLNQGGAVTKGLKKVTRDMQTHKNKALRAGGLVKAPVKKKVTKHRGIPQGTPKGPVLEGNKWIVEFHVDGGEMTIEPELKHSVYIYGCVNTVVKVTKKINQVTMDSSKKVSVVCQDVLSTVDVVNCNSAIVQVLGKSPTIAVEKTSGAQLYLSKDGLATEIITSKCDAVNVHIPNGDEFTETPIPEQFMSKIVDGTLVTNHVDHSD